MASDSAPYEFDPRFECVAVFYACDNKIVYNAVGRELEPNALGSELCQHMLNAAHAIAQDSGNPPASATLVLQRLRSWNVAGRIKTADLEKIYEIIEQVDDDASKPSPAQIIAELTPRLQARARRTAVREAMKAQQAGSDLTGALRSMERAERIGVVNDSLGLHFTPGDYTEINALKFGERAKFGIEDLDTRLAGGHARGGVMLIGAKSGGGKTTGLCHWAAEQWRGGLSVCYATFELAIGQIEVKIRASSSMVAINDILDADNHVARALDTERIGKLENCGQLYIEKFKARVQKWQDVVDWHRRCGERIGHLPQVLVIDFLGKMGKEGKGNISTYESQGLIMDAMHEYSVEEYIWVATASQAQRGKKERKIIGLDDLNESQGKVEGCDLFLSLNGRGDDNADILYWIGKHRAGASELGTGAIPHAFEYGRLAYPSHASHPEAAAWLQDPLFGEVLM